MRYSISGVWHEAVAVGQLDADEEMKIQGGKQDQYTVAFGGYNFMDFHKDYAVVNSLRLLPDVICELAYSLGFVYVGGTHLFSHLIEKLGGELRMRTGCRRSRVGRPERA